MSSMRRWRLTVSAHRGTARALEPGGAGTSHPMVRNEFRVQPAGGVDDPRPVMPASQRGAAPTTTSAAAPSAGEPCHCRPATSAPGGEFSDASRPTPAPPPVGVAAQVIVDADRSGPPPPSRTAGMRRVRGACRASPRRCGRRSSAPAMPVTVVEDGVDVLRPEAGVLGAADTAADPRSTAVSMNTEFVCPSRQASITALQRQREGGGS